MLASLAIPVFITGFGWIGWRVLQSQMVTCEACGVRTLQRNGNCPVCGSVASRDTSVSASSNQNKNPSPASNATIDVQAEEINSDP